jgi:hypothetical protein
MKPVPLRHALNAMLFKFLVFDDGNLEMSTAGLQMLILVLTSKSGASSSALCWLCSARKQENLCRSARGFPFIVFRPLQKPA